MDQYGLYGGEINVIIIQADTREDANKLENELIEKHKHSLVNKAASAMLPVSPELFPTSKSALKILGENIKLARLRRNLTTSILCRRANIGRTTYWKIENGDPSVLMGAYISVLFALGLDGDIINVASVDPVGRKIQDVHLLSGRERAF